MRFVLLLLFLAGCTAEYEKCDATDYCDCRPQDDMCRPFDWENP